MYLTKNMTTDQSNIVQFAFTVLFIGTLVVGVYLLRNQERFFGMDPEVPSETSGGRTYTKMLVFVVWAHVAALTGSLAFLLH